MKSMGFTHDSEVGSELGRGHALERDLVDRAEERVGIDTVARREILVDLAGGLGTLELLAVEQLRLEDREGLASLDKGLGTLAVTATKAWRSVVSPYVQVVIRSAIPALVSVKVSGLTFWKNSSENFFISIRPMRIMAAKVSQWKRTLGVVTPAETIAEAGADGNDILEGTAERDTSNIVDHADAEVVGVKELDVGQGKLALVGAVADGGLRELVAGDCCEQKKVTYPRWRCWHR